MTLVLTLLMNLFLAGSVATIAWLMLREQFGDLTVAAPSRQPAMRPVRRRATPLLRRGRFAARGVR